MKGWGGGPGGRRRPNLIIMSKLFEGHILLITLGIRLRSSGSRMVRTTERKMSKNEMLIRDIGGSEREQGHF